MGCHSGALAGSLDHLLYSGALVGSRVHTLRVLLLNPWQGVRLWLIMASPAGVVGASPAGL